MIIRYGIGVLAANSAGQKAVWAKRDRKAKFGHSRAEVDAQVAMYREMARNESARQAELERIAAELVTVQAEVLALEARQTAAKMTVKAGNLYISSRYSA
jgi:hypothetical protein